MEHVGRHLEKDKGVADVRLEPGTWNVDEKLEGWFEREGLIERGESGWRIGDGRPKRGHDREVDEE